MENHSVVIIGGGMAGLTCASYLVDYGIIPTILEAAEHPGGRIRTDQVNGFLLDRGFQVLLTAYPETRKLLDYEALQLHNFRSGAMIRMNGKLVKMPNPLREPLSMPQAVMAPVGTLPDKFNVMRLVQELEGLTEEAIWQEPAISTIAYLSRYGWSEKMIKTFFQPFLGGIFLEKELITSSNFFRFVFQQFYMGDAALPARGMQAMPEQVARTLPSGCLQLNRRVSALEGNYIWLENGDRIEAQVLVLATDAATQKKLLRQGSEVVFNQTSCVYFEAPVSPLDSPMLVLNTDSRSLINHLCVPSDIAPGYAPEGKSLISVNLLGQVSVPEDQLAPLIQAELTDWFGDQVQQWRHLKTYHIPEALPRFTAEQPAMKALQLEENRYCCGDAVAYPSLNAAMRTGRMVAQMILDRKENLQQNR